ncbi:hypothetical protein ACFLSJ_05590 [Verrucomicrobiota bacterium]
MRRLTIGRVELSALCIGGNPFSGFSHQSEARSREMVAYCTPGRIIDTLQQAGEAGINTVFARTDDHIFGIMREYYRQGGTLQWFAQVNTPNDGPSWQDLLKAAVGIGCEGAYIHGGVVDCWYANGETHNCHEAVALMRELDVKAVGMAGHSSQAHAWMNEDLDLDFQMCCYYNPTDRSQDPEHQSVGEKWRAEDRDAMLSVIRTIRRPVVHYKVFAGGNLPIIEGFERLGKAMRPGDVACVGVFLKDDPDMITKDVALFEKYVDGKRPVGVGPAKEAPLS